MRYAIFPVLNILVIVMILLIGFSVRLSPAAAHTTATPHHSVATTTVSVPALQSLSDELLQSVQTTSNSAAKTTSPATAARLLTVAKQRANVMRTLAAESPELFLRNVIPATTRAMFSVAVQNEIEQSVTKTGAIEVYHSDDFVDPTQSHFSYHLTSNGQRDELYLAGVVATTLTSSDQVSVTGYALPGVTVAGTANLTVLAKAKPESVGVQRTLIMPITSPAISNIQPYTKAQIQQVVFHGPFQDYFKEQSYNNVSFAGTVTDWISIPAVDYPSWACGGVSLSDPAISAYIQNKNIDLLQYDRIVYLYANRGGGCAQVGKSDKVFNGINLRISEGWSEMYLDPSGTYQLFSNNVLVPTIFSATTEEYAFTHCRLYAKSNPTKTVRCNWNGVEIYSSLQPANWSRGLTGFSYVLSHEVGHNLGVMHANALHCTGTDYTQNCQHVEYGNAFDVMGYGLTSPIIGGTGVSRGGHYNAFYKNYLGWLTGTGVKTATQSGTYTVSPLETASGTRMITLKNPLLPTHPLYIEYRQPIGFDSGLPLKSAGLFINETPYPDTTRLLNANQLRTPAFTQPALMPGKVFYDPARGIRIDNSVALGGQTSFQTTMSTPVCIRGGLALSTTGPFVYNVVAGSKNVWLSYLLQNNDSSSCASSTVTLTGRVTGAPGWSKGTVYPNAPVTLAASGAATYVGVDFTVPATVLPGQYGVTFTVTDTVNARTQTIASQINVVASPVITAITPAYADSGDALTISGSGFNINPKNLNLLQLYRNDGSNFSWYLASLPAQSATRITFTLPQVCADPTITTASKCPSGNFIDVPAGQYEITLIDEETGSQSNVFLYTAGPDPTTQKLTLTAPNGGEQWELNTMNDITWAPYSYAPLLNPATDVEAYLERATTSPSGTSYQVVGKLIDNGKASLHWMGEIQKFGRYPTPGQYFVRVINTKTGEWDRSAAPFTLLPQPVNLKINQSNGPVALTDNQSLTVTWTAINMASCTITGVRKTSGGNAMVSLNVPAKNTTQVFYADAGSPYVFLSCVRANGQWFSDFVSTTYATVPVAPAPGTTVTPSTPSLAIKTPNGGESLSVGQPYTITWNQTGLVSPSIALYQNDKWVKWLATDINQTSFTWIPLASDAVLGTGQIFKIYITADKLDGTGYIDDKSNSAFEITPTSAAVGYVPGEASALLGASLVTPTTIEKLTENMKKLLTALQALVSSRQQ